MFNTLLKLSKPLPKIPCPKCQIMTPAPSNPPNGVSPSRFRCPLCRAEKRIPVLCPKCGVTGPRAKGKRLPYDMKDYRCDTCRAAQKKKKAEKKNEQAKVETKVDGLIARIHDVVDDDPFADGPLSDDEDDPFSDNFELDLQELNSQSLPLEDRFPLVYRD